MCALTPPILFDQDKDGRVLLLTEGALNDAELDMAHQAIALCPSRTLSLRDGADDVRPREPRVNPAAPRNEQSVAVASPRMGERK